MGTDFVSNSCDTRLVRGDRNLHIQHLMLRFLGLVLVLLFFTGETRAQVPLCSYNTTGLGGTIRSGTPLSFGGGDVGYPFDGSEDYRFVASSIGNNSGSLTYNFNTTQSDLLFGFSNIDFKRRWFTDGAGNPLELELLRDDSINGDTRVEYNATLDQWVIYDADDEFPSYNAGRSANGVVRIKGTYNTIIQHYDQNLTGSTNGTDAWQGGFVAGYCTITGSDYSDGPAGYGTASHAVDMVTLLGEYITSEVSAVQDADNATDDGVSSFPNLAVGVTSYNLPRGNLSGYGTGNIYAWIDFNQNGTYEASEFASTTINSGVIASSLDFNGFSPPTTVGTTYARIRITSDTLSASDFASAASDGEVEDYALNISAASTASTTCQLQPGMVSGLNLFPFNNPGFEDTVAAMWPTGMTTIPDELTVGSDQWHRLQSGLSAPDYTVDIDIPSPLGTGIWNMENIGTPSPFGGRAVWASSTGSLTEGIRQDLTGLTIGQTYSIPMAFTSDGTYFLSANMGITLRIYDASNTLIHTDTVTRPASVAATASGWEMHTFNYTPTVSDITIRLSGLQSANAQGVVFDMACDAPAPPPPTGDRSDAPADGSSAPASGTTSYGEASHVVTAGIQLGAAIDVDAASIASANGDGDGSDDDGITSLPTLVAGDTSYTIPAANITASGTGTLYAWIDFDGDGAFEVSEFASVAVSGGTPGGDLTWSGQTTMAAGTTFARFRLTSDSLGSGDFASSASDGEVEDYALAVIAASPALDIAKTASYGAGPTTANGTTDNLTVGTIITYTYTITNTGNQAISNVSLSDIHGGTGADPVPDADTATLIDNGTTGDSTNATTGDNEWDMLAPGDVLTVTATYTVTQGDVDTLQ